MLLTRDFFPSLSKREFLSSYSRELFSSEKIADTTAIEFSYLTDEQLRAGEMLMFNSWTRRTHWNHSYTEISLHSLLN